MLRATLTSALLISAVAADELTKAFDQEPCDNCALSLAQLRGNASTQEIRQYRQRDCEMSEQMQIRWTADPTLCLSSDSNRIGNGVTMQLWKCDETWSSPGQIFKQNLLRWAADERIRMAFNSQYCIVVDNDDFKNGAKIQLWECDDFNAKQDWVLWSHFGGSCSGMIAAQATNKEYCMVVDGNNGFDGAKVQLWTCEGDQYAKTWSPWTKDA